MFSENNIKYLRELRNDMRELRNDLKEDIDSDINLLLNLMRMN